MRGLDNILDRVSIVLAEKMIETDPASFISEIESITDFVLSEHSYPPIVLSYQQQKDHHEG